VSSSLGKGIRVGDLAQKVLDGVVAHFLAADVALPDRRYVAPGNPQLIAWDCEQLVVALTGIGWGSAPDAATGSVKPAAQMSVQGVRHAVFSIQLVRCTPVSKDTRTPWPPAEEIQAAGVAFMRDAGLLSQALVTLVAELRQGLAPDRSGLVEAGALSSLGPEGAHHGMEATLAVTSLMLE
jgi:hypothetical protein